MVIGVEFSGSLEAYLAPVFAGDLLQVALGGEVVDLIGGVRLRNAERRGKLPERRAAQQMDDVGRERLRRAEAAMLINFLLNEKEGAEIMGSECGLPASKAGLEAAQAAGKIKELVAEANGKVMAFVGFQLDPLFEANDLKANGTGIYQEVFDTVDYDNASGADVVDTLLDGMSAVGYTV